MNAISPTRVELSVEDTTDRLLAVTNANWAAYRKLVAQFAADFHRLEWPIGFPARHFDAEHVLPMLLDTLVSVSAQQLRAMAENKAWEMAE